MKNSQVSYHEVFYGGGGGVLYTYFSTNSIFR